MPILRTEWRPVQLKRSVGACAARYHEGRINGEVKVTHPRTANSMRTICRSKETVALLIREHAKHPSIEG